MMISKYIKYIFYTLLLSAIYGAYPYHTLGVGIHGSDIIQSATFYHSSNICYGLDFLHLGVDISNSETYDYDYGSNTSNGSSGDLSVNLLMPRLGYRMPNLKIGSVQTYNYLEGYLVLPLVDTGGDFKITNDQEDQIKDSLTFFGIKIGHEVEYNFTKQFSLATDVGLNWIFWDSKTEDSQNFESWEYGSYVRETENQVSANLAMTYIKLSLHFKLQN